MSELRTTTADVLRHTAWRLHSYATKYSYASFRSNKDGRCTTEIVVCDHGATADTVVAAYNLGLRRGQAKKRWRPLKVYGCSGFSVESIEELGVR